MKQPKPYNILLFFIYLAAGCGTALLSSVLGVDGLTSFFIGVASSSILGAVGFLRTKCDGDSDE